MRLNKYIASAGICSRRKADELIAAGNVKVNGAAMREMGYDVQDGDRVEVNGRPIEAAGKKVYVALNKPLGYVTTMKDENRFTLTINFIINLCIAGLYIMAGFFIVAIGSGTALYARLLHKIAYIDI